MLKSLQGCKVNIIIKTIYLKSETAHIKSYFYCDIQNPFIFSDSKSY